MAGRARSNGVFINCPFDDAYQPLFRAIIFAIHDCGFIARSALAVSDSVTGKAIEVVRDWLDDKSKGDTILPDGSEIARRYDVVVRELPAICSAFKLKVAKLTFKNYGQVVVRWLKGNPL